MANETREELLPPESETDVRPSAPIPWLRWGAGALLASGALVFTFAFAAVQPNLRPKRELQTGISCLAVSCGRFSANKVVGFCDGAADSDECNEHCCGDIQCDKISDFSCSSTLGLTFVPREVPEHMKGMHMNDLLCKGESQCKEKCCQGTCANTVCDGDFICKRPYAPARCTPSTCQSQCCYERSYCGSGLNAWSLACENCESKKKWCERELDTPRSSVSREDWNGKVLERLKEGLLAPGCEEDDTVDCRMNLKYHIASVFGRHRSLEGVSVNTVSVVPGGTEALSGGDDMLVYKWEISSGKKLHNYSAHTSKVVQVFPTYDATFFCAATEKEVLVWLVQAGHTAADSIEMEFVPDDPRKGAKSVSVTGCIGLNTYEKVVVGLNNSFTILWELTRSHFLPVPVDPKLEFRWEIKKDFGYYKKWPKWDKKKVLKKVLHEYWRDKYALKKGYTRRLQRSSDAAKNSSERQLFDIEIAKHSVPWILKKLKRAGPGAPPLNIFTNLRWGDIPSYYYKPDGWGAVTSMVQIPSDLLYAVGYEDGSIRLWKVYNGFIDTVIPKAHAGPVKAMAAAPAGNMFYSGGDDGFIRIWSATDSQPRGSIYAAFAGPIASLAMIPGGGALYSGHYGGRFYLWELVTKSALCQLDTQGGKVNSLAVDPGRLELVLTALENGEVRTYQKG